jgi:hypothetical protein
MDADCPVCRDEIARLKEENASLRRTALALGNLAERLDLALKEERGLNQPAQQQLAVAGGERAQRAAPADRPGRPGRG